MQLFENIPDVDIQCQIKIQVRFEDRSLKHLLEEAEVREEEAICFHFGRNNSLPK